MNMRANKVYSLLIKIIFTGPTPKTKNKKMRKEQNETSSAHEKGMAMNESKNREELL